VFYDEIIVLTGNLALPVRKALIASFTGTPQISNKTVPALTLIPQWDTDPFPLPILTSVGFFVIGIQGKILIHNFPFLFNFLTIDCLADSICLAVIVPDFIALSPISPNFKLVER